MSAKKKAKFFCENCGSEVPENAKVCKHCGKFFVSIRCPKCGQVGDSKTFQNGCPNCGYLMKKGNALTPILQAANASGKMSSSAIPRSTTLPVWVYVVTGLIFFVVVVAVYSCIKQ